MVRGKSRGKPSTRSFSAGSAPGHGWHSRSWDSPKGSGTVTSLTCCCTLASSRELPHSVLASGKAEGSGTEWLPGLEA